MTHAAQYAMISDPNKKEPFLRDLALGCALDGELPGEHWLEIFSRVPERLPRACLLPHELQAWRSTHEALHILGRNNPEHSEHIEQALLYISPTL